MFQALPATFINTVGKSTKKERIEEIRIQSVTVADGGRIYPIKK